MASSEKNEYLVDVVKDLEKTITAESHLASILDEINLDPENLIGENQTPMIRITYAELDLSGIEATYRADKGVLSLRNFLVGKKKGLDKNKCVFGLYCITEDVEGMYAVYYLHVDKNLYQRVEDSDADRTSRMVGKIRICGLYEEDEEDELSLETGFFYNDWTFGLKFEGESLKSTLRLAKTNLQKLEKRIITFYFSVSLDCTPSGSHEWYGIEYIKGKSMSILKQMYKLPDSSKDVTIVAAGGAEVKAHKSILMAHCSVFYSMLNSENATAEAQTAKILMEENSQDGLTQLIRYFYGFRLITHNFSPDLALEMFQLSHKYGLKELEADMKDLLTDKGIEWYSVDAILELYFYVENNQDFEELRAHALTEMSELSQEALTESDFFKRLDSDKKVNLRLTLWNWGRIKI